MPVVTVRVPPAMKRQMDQARLNWSEELREAIEERLQRRRRQRAADRMEARFQRLFKRTRKRESLSREVIRWRRLH